MSRCDEQECDVWDESELKNEIQFYVSSFILSDKDKENMWNTIHDMRGKKSYAMVKRMFRISAAVFVCVMLFGIGINVASKGRVAEVIREFCGMQQESVQIIGNTTPESENYAPPLLFCDQSYVIFANSRGMVIYNRERERVTATIDLQEISCNYFTADTIMTKVIVDGKKIIVFNVQVEGKESTVPNGKNKKVQGDCYVFELTEPSDQDTVWCLKPVEKTKDQSLPEWWEKKMSGCYVDTFEELGAETVERWSKEEKQENLRYSEESVRWSSDKGENYISCLLMKKSGYQLYTVNTATGESENEPLSITLSEEAVWQNETANTLPKYVYTGKDMKLKAICDYLVENETEEEEYPLIPAPLIYDTIKEDGVWKVFGNFWYFYYYKNGNTLEEKGGSEMPACFHLKKVHGAYTVVKVERPRGGGAKYVEGIRKFCKGHPEVYKKFFRNVKDIDKRDKIQKKQIKQYVKDNQLDVKQYHAYGWDPVELFPEK